MAEQKKQLLSIFYVLYTSVILRSDPSLLVGLAQTHSNLHYVWTSVYKTYDLSPSMYR